MDETIINNFASKINEKEKSSNKTSSWSGTTNNIRYPTEKLVKDSLDAKSDSTHTHNSQISYGQVDDTSTSTVFTATVSGVTALADGTTVMLKNGVVTSASGFTLNVNNLGPKPVYNNMAAASADTTIFNVNYTMLFVYDSTRISGGCWICYRGYNSDNNTIGYQLRTNSSVFTASDRGYRYRLWLQCPDGKLMPINTSTSTNATAKRDSAMNTRKFVLGGKIVYNSTKADYSADAALPANTLWQQYNFTFGYSFNNTGSALTLTPNAPIYMVCTDEGHGLGKLASPYYTQTLPNAVDNKLYVYLGMVTTATTVELGLEHPIFEYRNGGIGLWSNNGHSHTTSQITDFPSTMTPSSHTHGNLQNDGSVGTSNNASKNVVTDSSGKITTEAKPTIPTKTSDLQNDSGFLTSHQDISSKLDKAQTSYKGKNVVVDSSSGNIAFEDKNNHTHSQYLTSHQSLANYVTNDDSRLSDSRTPTSHTHGNLQNNGQIGSTAQANKNVVTNGSGLITTEDKPTIPSASSTTPSADTTNGSVGNGTTWARSNHTHPKSSLYAEASHTHTKSEVTDFPTLHTVATSGSYNDLSDKPNIPEGSTVDTTLSGTSNNAIANSTVKNALDNKLDKTHTSYKGKNVVVDSTTGNITFEDKNNHTHSNYLTSHQDISGKEDKSNKSSSISTDTGSTSKYPSVKAVEDYTHIDIIDARLQKEEIVYGTIYKTDSSKTYINGAYYKVSSSIPSELILFKLPDDINTSSTKSLCIKISYYYNSYTNPSSLELDVKYNNNIVKENTFLPNTIILLQDATSYFDIVGVLSPNSTGSYNDLTNKPSIPSKTSDLTNDSGFLTSHQDISSKLDKAQTSYKGKNVVVDSSTGNITFEEKNNHTHGNLQNNGQVGSTAQANKNVVTNSDGLITTEDKPTIPSASSSIPSADTTNGSVGTGTTWARSNHTHPKSSIYAESTHSHTKSEISDFPSLHTVATSGSYNDLTNKPNIPSKTSDLQNDGDGINAFLTQHQSLTNYLQQSDVKNNLTSTDTNKPLSANQGKVLNTNKIETSAIATSFASTTSDSKVPSEKLTKTELDKKIAKSSTSGLVKNDGTIDTTSYSTFSGSYNDLSNKPSIPSKTSDLTNDGADGTNVFVANNDSRLSDARTPTSHTHTSNQVSDLIDTIYPVGSIYMSVSNTSPSILFGGTWEQIENKFLLASGSTYSSGATGGEATHTLTENEIPSHTHTQIGHSHHFSRRNVYVASGNAAAALGHLSDPSYGDYYTDMQTPTINNTGGGQAHNNMPPYLVVNVWKRTA